MISKNILLQARIKQEFKPYIQSIVCSKSDQIIGGELLLRWHTSDGRIIYPDAFISLADSTGVLPDITIDMIKESFCSLSRLGFTNEKRFYLSVNITPSILYNKNFIDNCINLSRNKNLLLIFELTEQYPFLINNQVISILQNLKEKGIGLALDDFGTNCSVLSYLQYFPIDFLKIDKVFTQNICVKKNTRYIIESIIDLSFKLNIKTIAEGIENLEQINELRLMGVDFF
ncbi:TPA: EAL domain-containing protein, partial [Escherichia coli]